MTKDEVRQALQNIGTCEDDATRRTLLADLQTSLEADYTAHEDTVNQNTTFQQQINQLQENNMKLFLKIGDPTKPEQKDDKPAEKLKFSDLFNDKGGLK